MRRHVRWLFIAALTAAAAMATASSTSALVVDMSVPELTAKAHSVVIAQVVAQDSHWSKSASSWYGTSSPTGGQHHRCAPVVLEVLKGEVRRSIMLTITRRQCGRCETRHRDAPGSSTVASTPSSSPAKTTCSRGANGAALVVAGELPSKGLTGRQLRAQVARQVGKKAEVIRYGTVSALPARPPRRRPVFPRRHLSVRGA